MAAMPTIAMTTATTTPTSVMRRARRPRRRSVAPTGILPSLPLLDLECLEGRRGGVGRRGVLALDEIVDLLAVHRDRGRRVDPEADLVAADDVDHRDADVVPDDERLADLAGQNQHGQPSLALGRLRGTAA